MGNKALYMCLIAVLLLSPGCAYQVRERRKDSSLGPEFFKQLLNTDKKISLKFVVNDGAETVSKQLDNQKQVEAVQAKPVAQTLLNQVVQPVQGVYQQTQMGNVQTFYDQMNMQRGIQEAYYPSALRMQGDIQAYQYYAPDQLDYYDDAVIQDDTYQDVSNGGYKTITQAYVEPEDIFASEMNEQAIAQVDDELEKLQEDIAELASMLRSSSISVAAFVLRGIKKGILGLRKISTSVLSYGNSLYEGIWRGGFEFGSILSRVGKYAVVGMKQGSYAAVRDCIKMQKMFVGGVAQGVDHYRNISAAAAYWAYKGAAQIASGSKSILGYTADYARLRLSYGFLGASQDLYRFKNQMEYLLFHRLDYYYHLANAARYHLSISAQKWFAYATDELSQLHTASGKILSYIYEHLYQFILAADQGVAWLADQSIIMIGRISDAVGGGAALTVELGHKVVEGIEVLEGHARYAARYMQSRVTTALVELALFGHYFAEHVRSLSALCTAAVSNGLHATHEVVFAGIEKTSHGLSLLKKYFVEHLGLLYENSLSLIEQSVDGIKYGIHQALDYTGRGLRNGVETGAWALQKTLDNWQRSYLELKPTISYQWKLAQMRLFMYAFEVKLRCVEVGQWLVHEFKDISQRAHTLLDTTMKWSQMRFTTMSAGLDAMLNHVMRYGVLIAKDSQEKAYYLNETAADYIHQLQKHGQQMKKIMHEKYLKGSNIASNYTHQLQLHGKHMQEVMKDRYDRASDMAAGYANKVREQTSALQKKLYNKAQHTINASKKQAVGAYDSAKVYGATGSQQLESLLNDIDASVYQMIDFIDYTGASCEQLLRKTKDTALDCFESIKSFA